MNLEWNIAGVRAAPQMPASLICPFSGWRMLDAAWESLSQEERSGRDTPRAARRHSLRLARPTLARPTRTSHEGDTDAQ